MEYTGKTKSFEYNGKHLRLCNQSCPDWTHLYNYPALPSDANDDLHAAGCGIFAIAHMIDYLCGVKIDIEALADFSMQCGGRGDDGTDRPVLLSAMQNANLLSPYALRYDHDGCLNDSDALWANLVAGGAALCDLRVGHITAVVDHRVSDGEKQVLIMDSSRDSVHPAVYRDVREVVPGSEFISEIRNASGIRTGDAVHYAMFWVPYTKPYDFNLLRPDHA